MSTYSFTQIEIDGFRGLQSLNLEGLGRINILVGRNNSGKTSVLEAISLLCQPQNPDEWLSMVRRRDFGGLDETIVQSLRWCFTQEITTDYETLIEASCKFKCNGNFPLRELEVKYNEFMGIPSPEEMRYSPLNLNELPTFDSTIMLNEAPLKSYEKYVKRYQKMMLAPKLMRGAELIHFPIFFKPQISIFDKIFNSTPYIDEDPKTLKIFENISLFNYRKDTKEPWLNCKMLTPYSYQTNSHQLQAQSKRIFKNDSPNVLELLQDFDPDIEGINMASFSGNRAAIYINHRKLGVTPLSVFGDAMRRAVLLAATLPSLKEGDILLIDEIEVGIHISALTTVFQWLVKAARELKIQLFVTTHSLEALDAIISNYSVQNDDDIVVFHLNQTPEKTQCKRFSGDLLHRLRFERGLDVR